MKKKVAIFANGWSNEYLELVLEGVKKKAEENNVDLYAFINYASGEKDKPDNLGEKNIFILPDISQFDGVMLLANTINIQAEREYLSGEVQKYHIPAVSLEYELEGIPWLGTDTYSGMYELTKHLTRQHGVRKVVYVSGPADNAENKMRLQAVRDALAKVDAALQEEDMLYCEWSYYTAYATMCDWLQAHEELPDAFICANDEMAIGVCAALDRYGKKVPEHVIVTGCDCNKMGQELYPILTTVARGWDKLGYDGLELLLKQMAGENIPKKTEYESTPVLGESCGCKVDEERKVSRRRSIIRNHKNERQSSINEWHLRHIDEMLAKMTNTKSLKDHLGWNFAYNHTFEGANFFICLLDNYFSEEESETVRGGAYTEKMDVCVHIEKGKAKPGGKFYSRDLLPEMEDVGMDREDGKSHFYLFVPLHVEAENLGYVVFVDELRNIYDKTLYTWARHVSQDLDRVRQNIRLEELNKKLIEVSMTDALTGLKNRTGYDALAFPCLQRCQKAGKPGAMIFADVNRMKLINDKYGHLQGDIALCTVADAIKMTMPPEWIAVRFGGDEFIMVGECQSNEEAEELKNRLSQNLEKLKEERDLCFRLTASFGAVVIRPEENYTLEEYLRKADEAMYVMKQKAHEAEKS